MRSNHRPSSPFKHGSRRLLSLAAVMAIALGATTFAGCGGHRQTAKSVPSPEEKAYFQNIQITPGRVEAAQNFLNHTVTTVHGTVSNKGNQSIRYLKISLTFSDIEGKPIQQKTADVISRSDPPLKPGETREFQVSFDEVPPVWNQAAPRMAPARVVLAGE